MNCFRCDGKGKLRNEFGLMEKFQSCQKKEMTFEQVDTEPNSYKEGLWKKRLIIFTSNKFTAIHNQ